MSWKRTVHPMCTPDCNHAPTGKDTPQLFQLNATTHTREDGQVAAAKEANGRKVHYLGVYGPTRGGDDPWPCHVWQIGGEVALPVRRTVTAPKQESKARNSGAIYRPEVWLGSGELVGPIDFSRVPDEVEVAFPAPRVGATTEGSVAKPKPVLDLEKFAGAYGWDYLTTYACGWVPHATHGRPTSEDPKESWKVRMRRGAVEAVAVRMGGSWMSLWTWSATQFFTPHNTLDAFLDALAGVLVDQPSRKLWDAMEVHLPKRPTREEWKVIRGLA